MIFNQKYIFQQYPWLKEKNRQFIISADYDGLICAGFLHHYLDWELVGYYNFEHIWISKEGLKNKSDLIWVDLNILPSQGKAIGGHIITLDGHIPHGFMSSCNPNILAGISAENFNQKYPFSTILFLYWLHKIVLSDKIMEKALLLHADAVWLKMQKYPKNIENWAKRLPGIDWEYLFNFANTKLIEETVDQELYPMLAHLGAVSGKSKLKSKHRKIHSKEYKFNPDWDEDVILSLLNLFAIHFKWTPPKVPQIEKCISGKRYKIPISKIKSKKLSTVLREQRVFSYAIPSPNYFNFTTFGSVRKSPLNND